MHNYLVSIIVPVYKVEKYLNKCVDSIVNQTYKNLEIILVDDGSPDNCPAMCDEWAQRDGRIKVIHKDNGGLADARNFGLDAATGDYLMYADSDDFLEYDMVEFLLGLIVENNADVSRCGIFIDYEDNSATTVLKNDNLLLPDYNERFIDLATNGHLSGVVWNKMYRFSAVKDIRFDKADGCSEDIMYNFRVFNCIKNAVYYDVPKYHYLIRDNSITNSEYSEGVFCILRAKKIILDSQKDNPIVLPYCIKGYIFSAFIVINGMISNQKFLDRYEEIRNSILKYKKQILFSNLYSKREKFKTLLLFIFPRLYKKLILMK